MKKNTCLLLIAFCIFGCSKDDDVMPSYNNKSKIIKLQSETDSFYVYDRNTGVNVPVVDLALNYSNNKNHADYVNADFKGDYYPWNQAIADTNSNGAKMCADGWRLPTKDEMNIIAKAIQITDNTAYIEDGDGNKCYFPLSGSKGSGASHVGGSYWSGTENDNSNAYFLSLGMEAVNIHSNLKSYSCSVRCVKTEQ